MVTDGKGIIDRCVSSKDLQLLRDVGLMFGYPTKIIDDDVVLKYFLKQDLGLFETRESGIRGKFSLFLKVFFYIIMKILLYILELSKNTPTYC